MSDKSPLFVSSLELIAHAAELFALKNPKKFKFIILHLANAVELLLKDSVIDQGISIYEPRNNNRTIGIWDCISKLKDAGINVVELPVLELLIDDRNTIQHRFGYPSAEATYYYIEQVVGFFKRFLNDHYGIQLAEALEPHLSKEHLKLLGLVKDEQDYLEYLDKLAAISIESSVLRAYNVLESELDQLIAPYYQGTRPPTSIWQNRYLATVLEELAQKGFIGKDINNRMRLLREARNFAAHSAYVDSSQVDWQSALATAKELISGLQQARKAGYTFSPDAGNSFTDKDK